MKEFETQSLSLKSLTTDFRRQRDALARPESEHRSTQGVTTPSKPQPLSLSGHGNKIGDVDEGRGDSSAPPLVDSFDIFGGACSVFSATSPSGLRTPRRLHFGPSSAPTLPPSCKKTEALKRADFGVKVKEQEERRKRKIVDKVAWAKKRGAPR